MKQKTLREDAHSREAETCRKRPRLARECAKAHSFLREDGAVDSENANKSKKKKTSNIIQICIGVLAVVLAALIIVMMGIVSSIQGTARVVNYAGLVRGKTQRIIKLEISGQPEDGMIQDIEVFVDGLQNGNGELGLVRLDDGAFQSKMQELEEYFAALHYEILRVREVGYKNTEIIDKSERFFEICDEATGLAEAYSQRKASSLTVIEKYITIDIIVLMLLIGYEFIKAVRFAAMNRVLQKKVYLDKATGLPNKNKCEELLDDPEPAAEDVGVCSFDLNNLRRINNSMGHEAGDAYIRRFAVCLRASMPAEQFVGRDGGDEFIAVTHGLDEDAMRECLTHVREAMTEESKGYPDTPLSYAVGYALASDFPGSTMRELFNFADKNMYINKNHVKREEAAAEKRLDFHLLKLLKRFGRNFSDCLYCDAHMDTYRTLRASVDFFLASDGSYSGAAEQIATERVPRADRAYIRQSLQVSELSGKLQAEGDLLELQYDTNDQGLYSRLTLIPVDWDEKGKLHHFLLAFETIRKSSEGRADAKEQLTLYYEQLKQSILENDSYVDALLDLSDMIYTVNLTKDILEKSVVLNGKEERCRELFMDYPLPCSYRDYCSEYMKMVTQETLGSYRLADDPAKLLKRFEAGEKHISVEYCIQEEDGTICWVQKTVLMTQTIVFDTELSCEMPVVHAIILLQNTSQMHARDEQEHARLQAAFDEMRTANRAKTDFLSRMSHDIRTPLNGIIGLLKIDEAHFEDKEMVMENHRKMQVAAGHLLSLINDVLQMSKLEEGKIILAHDYISLAEMTRDIVSIIIERAVDAGIQWEYDKRKAEIPYPYIYGSQLHLRQIFLNIYGNCIKYNRPGGKISTRVEAQDVRDGWCVYRWTISDTGVGMSQEFLDHIFDPFVQEKNDARSVYQGTGLGMTIVKGLIEQMHGTIEVTSEVGIGTTFVVEIPFEIAPPPEELPVKEAAPSGDIHGLKLLLAEDNELNADIAETLLTDAGAHVTIVENGKKALDCFEAARPGTFDAILMDVMMPVMDGLAATRAIRAIPRADARQIPILAMTANAFEEDARQCLAAGMNVHLAKPLQMDKVVAALMECCGKKRDL